MIVLGIVFVIVMTVAGLLLSRVAPKKKIHQVNFTLSGTKGLPAKKFFIVNFVHNKDIVPVKNKSIIRNYVI